MSRESQHIANLNSINDLDLDTNPPGAAADGAEEDLAIFTNTNFYDFDIGRSTDIATTVDELLMQQEMQIQYPGKQDASSGANAGYLDPSSASPPSASSSTSNSIAVPTEMSLAAAASARSTSNPTTVNSAVDASQHSIFPFDISTLQEFSLAGELPPVSTTQHFYAGTAPSSHVFTPGPQDLHQLQPRQPRLHEDYVLPSSFSEHTAVPPGRAASPGSLPATAALSTRVSARGPSTGAAPVVSAAPTTVSSPVNLTAATTNGSGLYLPPDLGLPRSPASQIDSASDERSSKSGDSNGQDIVRQLADEDKRRRNTAASARFRIKKKLREQEMERNSREMQARINQLESKVKQLEMENRWLKNLVVERNEKRDMSDLEALRSRILGGAGDNGSGDATAAATSTATTTATVTPP